jgi:magnesium-transporting ATPase (P-type)
MNAPTTAPAAAAATPSATDRASQQPAADVARALGCDPAQGLDSSEAMQRLARDGANVLRAAATLPTWHRVLALLLEPLTLLLLAAATLAAVVWALEGAKGWPWDTLVIGAVVLLNTVLGWAQQARADRAVAALAQMTAATSSVLRDGKLHRLPSEQLVVGDLLVLGEGDAVGADARLLQATQLRVQEASLTGESEAVLKHADALAQAVAVAERVNTVFQGTAVVQGHAHAVVVATGMATHMGGIAQLLDRTISQPTPLHVEVAHLGRVLGLAALVVATAVVLLVGLLSGVRSGADAVHVLLLGVSLAVAAVPEGLAAILSVVLALGVQRMAQQRAVVKQLSSVETLGSATVIATDKTGTLTRAEMTVVRACIASGEVQFSAVGYGPGGQVLHGDRPLEDGASKDGPLLDEVRALLGCAAMASNARVHHRDGRWVVHGDPTEVALTVAAAKLGDAGWRPQRFTRFGELPFSAERQRMSTLQRDHEQADAPLLVTKGAPDVLLALCTHQRIGRETRPLDDAGRACIAADVARLGDAALRTLGVASRPLQAHETAHSEALETGLCYLGTVGMIDPPREEVAAAIRQAQGAGIRVVMITGDHPRTAARIAADLGILPPGADLHAAVLPGSRIQTLDDAALAQAVRHTAVYARVAPGHKLRIVAALQAGGAVVAMTGDGVNDAPALKAADIGIAMGLTGTEVSKQAARMILADDNFATLVHAVREGRGVFDNIRKFLRYLLSSNLGEVLTVLGGVLAAGLIGLDGAAAAGTVALPLLATQILWINLITDSGPALALGLDPASPDAMQRPPRARGARVVDAAMGASVLATGVVMAALTLLTLDMLLPGGLVEGHESLALARTAAFTTLVLAQLFNCLASRSADHSVVQGLFTNAWLWGALALSAALQVAVVHLGPLNQAFGTVPLSGAQWALCVGMASGVLVASELRKALRRLRGRRADAASSPSNPGIRHGT